MFLTVTRVVFAKVEHVVPSTDRPKVLYSTLATLRNILNADRIMKHNFGLSMVR